MIKMKTCTTCKEEKPLDEFPNNPSNTTDGKRGQCKNCHYARVRERHAIKRAIEEANKVFNIADYIKPAFKICTGCGLKKLLHLFYKEKGGKCGRKSKCIDCHFAYKQQPEVKEHNNTRERRKRKAFRDANPTERQKKINQYNEMCKLGIDMPPLLLTPSELSKQPWMHEGNLFNHKEHIANGFEWCVYRLDVEDGHGIIPDNSHYYGKRCMLQAFVDYMSSTKNDHFKHYIQMHSIEMTRNVMSVFKTEAEAVALERKLLNSLDENGNKHWTKLDCLNMSGVSSISTHHRDIVKRFWSKVQFDNECWIWMQESNGELPVFSVGHTMKPAKRFLLENIMGIDVSKDHIIHSICNEKFCINPDHLSIISKAEHRTMRK